MHPETLLMKRCCAGAFVLFLISFFNPLLTSPVRAQSGGFIEHPSSAEARPGLSASEIRSFLPARGAFTFPAPYKTEGVRITNASDCGGSDCVSALGYSYWRNINNHIGSDVLYMFVSLNRGQGGTGPTLFSYHKKTGEVKNLGALFANNSSLGWNSGEGWYFSGTQETKLYVQDGARMLRHDVLTKKSQTVFDVASRYGSGHSIWQMHSSDDDKTHSATLRNGGTVGCVVYLEDRKKFLLFPSAGDFDECHIDKSGRWLMSLENVDGADGLEMRVIDIAAAADMGTTLRSGELISAGVEKLVYDRDGAVGHADMGYGYVVGADNWSNVSNAYRLWDFEQSRLSGELVSYNNEWSAPGPNHLSHTNARSDVPPEQQYACGSSSSGNTAVWGNEIICFLLDGSYKILIAAPVMTNMNAASGGDSYNKEPKGNLDVTGGYFIWTSNAGGDRVDAFLVKIPGQLLTGETPAAAAGDDAGAADDNKGGGGGGATGYAFLLIALLHALARRRGIRAALLSGAATCLLAVFGTAAAQAQSGGFIEHPATAAARPALSASQIQSFLPSRGAFTFPAPYNTRGVRITNASDCGGSDCVSAIGYSYWRNINNHTGGDTLYMFIPLNRNQGGTGPTLFSYNKNTEEVHNLGALFPSNSPLGSNSGEGWYFSGTQPTKLYVQDGARMLRYDVLSKQSQTVFDVRTAFGSDRSIWQMHSSDDDKTHSATLRSGGGTLGCVVYYEDLAKFVHFPSAGGFDECHIDKSGRWLMSLENIDGADGLEMRIIDLDAAALMSTSTGNLNLLSGQLINAGIEKIVYDRDGAVGHADMGYGYVVGTDNWSNVSNAYKVWDFARSPLNGELVSYNNEWSAPGPNHISHTNARSDIAPDRQYACGSSSSGNTAVWGNEIICFMLDGSYRILIAAPVMTNMNAASGGDSYNKEPKGNLDVTGRYFIWTSNTGGSRVDAFLVKVPGQLLTGESGSSSSSSSSSGSSSSSSSSSSGSGSNSSSGSTGSSSSGGSTSSSSSSTSSSNSSSSSSTSSSNSSSSSSSTSSSSSGGTPVPGAGAGGYAFLLPGLIYALLRKLRGG